MKIKEQLLYGIADTRGDGLVCILSVRLKDIQATHVFLVRGKQSYEQCRAAVKMAEVQQKTGVRITEFSDFSANPKDEEALKGKQLLLEKKPDVIIAIGGGSVMDMAKLIRHYAAEQGYYVPLWAIPTTAGTGAEATHFAVVYKEGVKHSVEAEDILPDAAILYPPFTYHNGAYLTACTGFDALAQAIEAYWNPKATEESRQYSIRAINLIYRQLPQCIAHPAETTLRDELAQGAYWAGRAINITKTTAPHAFSYVFTSKYGYPHGHAVALTFPFFMRLNGTADLQELLGFTAENAVQQMETYLLSIGLSVQLHDTVDVRGALQAVNLQRLANNPVPVTEEIKSDLAIYLENHKQ